jgi:regulatory protein
MVGTITAITASRRGPVQVYVDGRLALRLAPIVAAGAGLSIGAEISPDRQEFLAIENTRRAAIDMALRYLSFRPRTENEIRQYLAGKFILEEFVEETLARLRDLNLVDDAAFAQQWVDERQRSRPKGAVALRQELNKKGVSKVDIEAALPVDDPAQAEAIARRRARSLDKTDGQVFIRRLSSFLLRRGYSYEIVGGLVRRLWIEFNSAHQQDK